MSRGGQNTQKIVFKYKIQNTKKKLYYYLNTKYKILSKSIQI